jgi:hypothetical protein
MHDDVPNPWRGNVRECCRQDPWSWPSSEQTQRPRGSCHCERGRYRHCDTGSSRCECQQNVRHGDWLVGPAARQVRDLPLAVTLRAAARRAAARPAQAVAAHVSAAAYALERMSRRTDFGPARTTALMPPDGCRNTVNTAILHCSRACQRCHDAGRAGRGQATRQAQIAVTPAWNTRQARSARARGEPGGHPDLPCHAHRPAHQPRRAGSSGYWRKMPG